MWLRRAFFASVFAVGLAGSAHAQSASSDQRARELFARGAAAYEAERFDDAVAAFREAYLLSGRPALLYNIGQSELRLEHHALALEAFEGYLRQSPADVPLRSEVEERVRVLRSMGVVPPEDATIRREEDDPPSTPSGGGFDPIDHRIGTWIALGVSAAAAAAAIAVYYDGVSIYDGLLTACGASAFGCTDQEIAASGLPDRELATNALWIGAGAALTAAIVLYVVEGLVSAPERASSVRLDVGPGSLVLRGTF